LKSLHATGEVGHLDEGDEISGSRGDTADRFGDGDGFVFGGDDGGDTRSFGSAENGAEVVGVLHAVENQDEGIFSGIFDELDEITLREAWGSGAFVRGARGFPIFAVAVFAGVHGG